MSGGWGSGRFRVVLAAAILGALVASSLAVPARAGLDPDERAGEEFETTVRPILIERCLKCHGPEKQKGGLRLDSRSAVLKGGETGPAAVPGKPGESLLIDAVNYGEALHMPPKTRLPAPEVAALTRWVERGLAWPGGSNAASEATPTAAFDLAARAASHWAWRPVAPRTPPAVADVAWPDSPIDRFILARLEAANLEPAPTADRRALIRRLSFDLVGLPPDPDEVDRFVDDPAPESYERLVDRLLASPAFGERWGRHWLDLVRYAESRGHEFDPSIPNAWRYRDYVVRALNLDVPYDQFVTEHLAGDLVPTPRLDPVTGGNESILGTGFWFLGEEVHSPVDIRQDETDRMDNRLDVMTKTFLGLTVACARCHDHKFDAISQRDYYALSGFLISGHYRQVRFASMDQERDAARRVATLRDQARPKLLALAARALKPGIDRLARDLLDARERPSGHAWSAELEQARDDRSHPLHAFAVGPLPSEPPRRTEGRVVVDYGTLPALGTVQDGFAFGESPVRPGELRLATPGQRVGVETRPAAVRQAGIVHRTASPDVERDHGRLGAWDRAGQTLRTPEFTLESGRLWYLAEGAGRAYAAVNGHLLIAGPLHGALLTEWTDGKKGWRWVHHDLPGYKGHRLHVEFCPPAPGRLAIARVVDAEEEPPLPVPAFPTGGTAESMARDCQAACRAVVDRLERDRIVGAPDDHEAAVWADWLLSRLDRLAPADSPERKAFEDEQARLLEAVAQAQRSAPADGPTAPAMADGQGVDEYLLIRGASRNPSRAVPRRFLEAIAGDRPIAERTSGSGSGRLELAREMLAPTNPFTRRVLVNRVWHHLFGRGLVASVDNFGVLGEPPTHPELLDFLAERFVADGWSIKRLVRSIVTSRAYRMASRPDPSADLRDPENRLWHRANVRRLEAEPIRDAILAVSGRLDRRVGGPSVLVHLTPYMQGRGRPKSGPLDGDGRRSLYLAVRRNFLSPMMLAFDAPIPFNAVGRRNVSNVPAQALMLMNDPFVRREAERWADRVRTEASTPEDRIASLYRTAFARRPEPREAAAAIAFLKAQSAEFGAAADAWSDDPRAWSDLAHMLINGKEFMFID